MAMAAGGLRTWSNEQAWNHGQLAAGQHYLTRRSS
jgi:hypothetical protein